MKQILSAAACLFSFYTLTSQTATPVWGDDFRMHRGSTDLSVVYADKTGVFVREGHLAIKGFLGSGARESATLVKLDQGFAEQYHNDFNKELKGKEFENFFFIGDKGYVIASDYEKKDRTLTLYAAELNKADGELSGDWKTVTTWQKMKKAMIWILSSLIIQTAQK